MLRIFNLKYFSVLLIFIAFSNLFAQLKTTSGHLPSDFPKIKVTISNNTGDGFLFLAPAKNNNFSYLMILNNSGVPIYYKKKPNVALVYFKPQPNGLLTYYDTEKKYFYGMDSSYAIVDSFMAGNGYPTDFHELLLTKDNHSYLIIYDIKKVNMDTVITGGVDTANVVGCIIQELDSLKNVIWQWSSWDHFKITDANDFVDLKLPNIEYCHTNSVDIDLDGNIIISSKRMDEITKIDKNSGDIIWRLGGKKNQFAFNDDNFPILQQHDARILSNGNLLLFDNGLAPNRVFSRAVEYKLNDSNLTLLTTDKVWEYRNSPDEFSRVMGSVKRLANGNTLIGWGSSSKTPNTVDDFRTITEVTQSGTKVFEMFIENQNYSYQVFRTPWRTNLFTTNKDTIDFGSVNQGDSVIKSFNITNNGNSPIHITSYYWTNSSFSPVTSLPITIQPQTFRTFNIQYNAKDNKNHIDTLLLRSERGTEMVAQYVILKADSDNVTFVEEYLVTLPDKFVLYQNYPNPFNPSTTLMYYLPVKSRIRLTVYNILGEFVGEIINKVEDKGLHSAGWKPGNLSSGIYFYRAVIFPLRSNKKIIKSNKMLFLK